MHHITCLDNENNINHIESEKIDISKKYWVLNKASIL